MTAALPQGPLPEQNIFRAPWMLMLVAVLAVWGALIALMWPSFASMVAVWDSSETYTHGYVILPISLWLVWRQRAVLPGVPLAGDVRALPFIALLALMWVAARVAGIQVAEHYLVVCLALLSVWALLGLALVRALFFPLAYLLLMVPAGDSLIPHLINFTADFTVGALRLMDFPVYREGTFFSIPSGDWSVVEACSGIRYFLSSIVLGWLYAYLTYRSVWKRVAFGLASIVVPVLANGVRAVLIVLIAHFSGMKLAVGVDHLIYGWVWFGIVMLLMFWVGAYWREDREAPMRLSAAGTLYGRVPWRTALGSVFLVGMATLYAAYLEARAPQVSPLARVVSPSGWMSARTPLTNWLPNWVGMDDARVLHFARDGQSASVFLFWYGAQRQGAELNNSQNVLVHEKNEVWRRTHETERVVRLAGDDLVIREAFVDSPKLGQKLRVWVWQRGAGADIDIGVRGTLRLTAQKLLNRSDAATSIIIAAPYADTPEQAEPVLRRLAEDLRPALNPILDAAP